MKRIDILKNSLKNKEAVLDQKIQMHFTSVKSANGQPLNDKHNGHVTLRKWGKQNDSIRSQMQSIEKTKRAIDWQEGRDNQLKAIMI